MQIENTVMLANMIRRRPSLSVSIPTDMVPSSMPMRARLPMRPAWAVVSPHSWYFRMEGTVEP